MKIRHHNVSVVKFLGVLVIGTLAIALMSLYGCYLRATTAATRFQGRPLSEWSQQLSAGTVKERQQAVVAIDGILQQCLSKHRTMNCGTGIVVGKGHAEAAFPEIAQALVDAAADEDPVVRDAARLSIVKCPPSSRFFPNGTPVFDKLSQDPNPQIRLGAVHALSQQFTLAAYVSLLSAVDDNDPAVRDAAVMGIISYCSSRPQNALPPSVDTSAAVAAIANRINSQLNQASSVNVPEPAIHALAQIGTDDAVAALTDLLHLHGIGSRASVGLVHIITQRKARQQNLASSAFERLSTMLSDSDAHPALWAVYVLVNTGPPGYEAIEAALDDKDTAARRQWLDNLLRAPQFALEQYLPNASERGLAAVKESLAGDDIELRARLLRRLAHHEQSPQVIRLFADDLVTLLVTEDAELKVRCLEVLRRAGLPPEQIMPEYVKLLASENAKIRQYAAGGLGSLKAAATSAVPDLTLLLDDDNEPVRISAARALANIGLAAEPTVAALNQMARSDNSKLARQVATRSLRELGQPLLDTDSSQNE